MPSHGKAGRQVSKCFGTCPTRVRHLPTLKPTCTLESLLVFKIMSITTYKINQLLKWAVGCCMLHTSSRNNRNLYSPMKAIFPLTGLLWTDRSRGTAVPKQTNSPVSVYWPQWHFQNRRRLLSGSFWKTKTPCFLLIPALLQQAAGLSWTEMSYIPPKICLLPHPSPKYLLL